MTAKEYLSQLKNLRRLIDCRKHELKYWQDMASSISASNFEPHYNASRNTTASYVRTIEKVVAIQQDIDSKIIELVNLCEKVNKAIDQIPDFDEQLVLRYRYIDESDWKDIGAALNQSVRNIYRIHNRGLEHFSIPA
ncbi:MAG: DUF1492 domain-containing protein [Clostridia bacterium]|nr:DUF1492 domain-containing protein [Clostridia bacterium]